MKRLRRRRQSSAERPEVGSRQARGHEQMHVDPPEPAPHQAVGVDELQDLVVHGDRRLRQGRQERQNFVSTRQIPAGEFRDDERVTEDFSASQARGEAFVSSTKMIDPDGRVDEH